MHAKTTPESLSQQISLKWFRFSSYHAVTYQYESWGSDLFILLKKKNGPLGWLLFHIDEMWTTRNSEI
jgi:hypothetical protein